MTNSTKNILVICWDFPPNKAIGGRRWAKITSSLVKAGYRVYVICKQNMLQGELKWIDAATLSKVTVYYCHEHFLVHWLNDNGSLIKKIKSRLAKYLLTFFYKGTPYDKAIGIEKKISTLITKVITEQQINCVFVTGAPFNLLYYTARLRPTFKQLTLVCDYRDPWITAQNYGMKELSIKKKKEEIKKQEVVFKNADFITAPNTFLLQEIKHTYNGNTQRARLLELPHAFDPSDVLPAKALSENKKTKIVYAGTIYLGATPHLEKLNNCVTYLKQNTTHLPEIILYTDDTRTEAMFSANSDVISFRSPIGDKIFSEISSANYVLIILSEHNKNYVTSKFFEFLPYRKPYLYLGPPGYVSEKIVKEGLGYCLFEEGDLAQVLARSAVTAVPQANLDEYTFDYVTKKLMNEIVSH